jgi:hypothetical protein
MRSAKLVVVVLLLAVPLLAGCGSTSGDREAMETKFEQLDFKLTTYEQATSSTYNLPHFTRVTNQYIALVRHYKDLLGAKEAKRRLMEERDGIAPYCLPCAGSLDDEARKY